MSHDPRPDAGGPGGVDEAVRELAHLRDAASELVLAVTMCRPERQLLAPDPDRRRLFDAIAAILRVLNPPRALRLVPCNPEAQGGESIEETERRHHLERQALSFGRVPPTAITIAADQGELAREAERA